MLFQDQNEAIQKAAELACASLLPVKSKDRYCQTYNLFLEWFVEKNLSQIDENVMLAYFQEKSEALSPPSLWSQYSMLKLTISVNKNIDISQFKKLIAFIKRKNDGYEAKKSKIFTKEEIIKFLLDAPNHSYLSMKVIAVMGIAGACRTDEIYKMKLNDIEIKDDVAIVKILQSKNKVQRSFVIADDGGPVSFMRLLQDYIKLRPNNAQDERLLYRYERGRCVNQVIGKHTISNVPKEIAKFLKLQDINKYTGHSFRRTSTTFLANAPGIDILDLKRHGGWRSSSVAEGYIGDSYTNKIEISKKILNRSPTFIPSNDARVTNSCMVQVQDNNESLIRSGEGIELNNIPSINISNCSNFTINLNDNK